MVRESNLIVGVDIGTTKICAIISELTDEGGVDIIGIGTSPSKGLRKGVVVNIDVTVDSIKRALEEAELMAGVDVHSAFVGIAGGHIKGINSRGVIAVSGKSREITQKDIDRVIDAAKAVALPVDREVIHVLPQEYIVDGQGGIKEPLGMTGVRLESEVHIVTGAVTSAQNIIKCCNRAGLEVQDIVLQQLASSISTLTPDEKELGVVLVDIGGGTSDIAVFVEGSIWHTAVLSVGGDHVSNDIAIGLRTPVHEAEEIKKKYGCALASLIEGEESIIEVGSVGGRRPRSISRHMLCEIIRPRLEEIFSLVDREVRRAGFGDAVVAGMVVTGGSSILQGVPELAEELLNLPVRRGIPGGVAGLVDVVASPIYATAVGLVLYGAQNRHQRKFRRVTEGALFSRVTERMREWFGEFF
ncbi:MAG: cell division protein FtsA [Candidatus Methylomirabilales bacterium]